MVRKGPHLYRHAVSYSLTEEALERFLCETEMPKLRACFDDDFVDVSSSAEVSCHHYSHHQDDDYPLMTSGSTACVCLVDESTSPGSLAVANAGDCRAVLCRRGEVSLGKHYITRPLHVCFSGY